MIIIRSNAGLEMPREVAVAISPDAAAAYRELVELLSSSPDRTCDKGRPEILEILRRANREPHHLSRDVDAMRRPRLIR